MKITIFGGGGFIGSTIADSLLKDGHELRILSASCRTLCQFTDNEKSGVANWRFV